MPFAQHLRALSEIAGLMPLAQARAGAPEMQAFWAELVLDGLHQHLKLGRHDLDSGVSYKEMLKFQLLRPPKAGRGRGEVN